MRDPSGVASLNRGMRVLSRSMGRRGFGYVVALAALGTRRR
jgi:hypothetical protein